MRQFKVSQRVLEKLRQMRSAMSGARQSSANNWRIRFRIWACGAREILEAAAIAAYHAETGHRVVRLLV